MPKLNTECSELSVGFGLLQIEPQNRLEKSQIEMYFLKTLSVEKYDSFVNEFARDERTYRRFYEIGTNLRQSHLLFRNANLKQIQWEGPNRQASTVTVPKDIIALNTPISIKDSSDIGTNFSPHNLFVRVPQGYSNLKKSENWYLSAAPEEYQSLYLFARNTWCPDYPAQVTDYHKIKKVQRSVLADKIKTAEQLESAEFQQYQKLYMELCHKVAKRSADTFNQYFAGSLGNQERNTVLESVIRAFLRVGDTQYILCGLDKNKEFAVEIPDLTACKRVWKVKSLKASPDIEREQSVVKFQLILENKGSREPISLQYRAEIRWSHGRFCGNPEAKLYKEFLWTDVIIFTKIIQDVVFRRLQLIGTGGFGTVYKAVNLVTKEVVAIKELTDISRDLHEYERFKREVKIQSQWSHPNILPVLQSDLSAPTPRFVMPLAQNSLDEIVDQLNGFKNELERLHHIFDQILAGIKYVHDQGIVHRDLKPENILLFANDVVKIADFGLGKHLDPTNSDWGLTSTSESLGSLHYAAPEQMQSFVDADFRSDIYSLGKLLYNCLTKETPFPKLNLNLVTEPYRTIILRCTEEDPDDRYQSIDDLIEAFRH